MSTPDSPQNEFAPSLSSRSVPSGPFQPLKTDWREVLWRLLEEYAAEHPDFLRGTKPSLRKFAIAIGSDPTTLWGWLKEKNPKEPSFTSIAKLMRFLGKPLTLLVDGKHNLVPAGAAASAELVGIVEAGVWREPRMLDLQEDATVVPYAPDPRFRNVKQSAWRVNGQSINRVAPHGSYLITVRLIDLDRQPYEGELVICQRSRHGEVEYTAKRVHYEGDAVQLVPDSTDPRFQQPIWLKSDEKDADVVVSAEHLVIGMFRPFV